MYESFPNPETSKVEREQVLSVLKEKGPEDAEAIELLVQWTEEHQNEIEEIRDRAEKNKALMEWNIEYATLLYEAGCSEQAWDALNDSIDLPNNLGDQDTLMRMKELMTKIESGEN